MAGVVVIWAGVALSGAVILTSFARFRPARI
jgi:hypothetical protein